MKRNNFLGATANQPIVFIGKVDQSWNSKMLTGLAFLIHLAEKYLPDNFFEIASSGDNGLPIVLKSAFCLARQSAPDPNDYSTYQVTAVKYKNLYSDIIT